MHLHLLCRACTVQIADTWRKGKVSNPSCSCVEVAELSDGAIAVRNSRHPQDLR
jgi:hypothetical protein